MKISEEIVKLVQFKAYPEPILGGQHCGMSNMGVTLYCEGMGFSVTVDIYRSQIKNKELALLMFELYLMETKVI